MGNLPLSRTETCVNGAPVNPNLINEMQDMFVGGRRTPFERWSLPSAFWATGTAPTMVNNPQAGGLNAPVWKIPTAQSVQYSIMFEPGETLSDVALSVYGDAAVRLAGSATFATNLTGSATTTIVANLGVTAALAASWQIIRISTAPTVIGVTPTLLLSGGVLMLQLTVTAGTFLHFGSLGLYLSR